MNIRHAALLASVVLATVLWQGLAVADDTSQYQLNVPPQHLRQALKEFARQTQLQVVYYTDIAQGVVSRGASGSLSADDALNRILDGTGLEFVFVNERTVAIRGVQLKDSANSSLEDQIRVAESSDAQHAQKIEEEKPALKKQPEQQEQEIVVTGSHIRGSNAGATPITTYDREQIQRLGMTTAGEILGLLPQNQGSSTTSPYGNTTFGASRFPNLRGLGEGTTLVLINGQRPVTSANAVGNASLPAQFNLDVIPTAAIERIDILRDGASAIYGSDAIGGVINVILRRDFAGVEVSGKYLEAENIGVREKDYSAVLGHQFGRLSVLVGGEYYDRNGMRGGEREYSASLDKRPLGGTNGFSATFSGPLLANITARPGTGNLPGLSSTVAAVPGGAPRTLQVADFVSTQGQSNPSVDYTVFAPIVSPQDRASAFGHADLTLTDTWNATFDVLYSKSKTSSDFRFPYNTALLGGVFGAANPYNPFGVDTNVAFYLLDVPFGLSTHRNEDFGTSLGMSKRISGDWLVQGRVFSGESKLDDVERGYDFARVSQALSGTTQATALNPLFGGRGSSPALLQSLVTTSLEKGVKLKGEGITVETTGSIFTLPQGQVELALGAETRRENFGYDQFSVNSPVPVIVHKGRDTSAAYLEVGVPLASDTQFTGLSGVIDLSLAARFEHYSDFGNTTNPKIGLSWQPVRDVVFHGTWGTAFQAPSLSQLYSPPAILRGVLFGSLFDPVLNQSYVITDVVQQGNPDLHAQEADTLSIGVNFRHAFDNGSWSASLDFYQIDFTDNIRRGQVPPQELIALESTFPHLIIRDPTTRRITRIVNNPVNLATADTAGFDFALGYDTSLLGGVVNAALNSTYITEYKQRLSPITPVLDRRSYVGYSNRLKGNLQLQYSRQMWSASAIAYYAAPYRSDRQVDTELRSQTTLDLQMSYLCCGNFQPGFRTLKLTAGVANVFNREPPFYNSQQGFDTGEGNPLQRRYYAKLTFGF